MRRFIIAFLLTACMAAMLYSCQTADQVTQDMYYTNGRDLYLKRCQNCHGAQAEGLADLIPPLTDSIYLSAHKNKLACIIKNGMRGKISVDRRTFDEKMPDASDLNDIDIAQLIVYITNSNGSKQGMYTTRQVATDLSNCK